MLDTGVIGGQLLMPSGAVDGLALGIADGEIVWLGKQDYLPQAEQTIDAAGLMVLPGLVDPHTHPGNLRPFEEDVRLTTRSAAAGGVTTMFGTVKSTRLGGEFKRVTTREDVVSYLDRFSLAREIIEREASVDVGLSFTIATDEQASEVPIYAERLGVRSFKFHPAGFVTPWHGRVGMPVAADEGTIFLALEGVAQTRSLAMVHAENRQTVRVLGARQRATGAQDLASWERASPGWAEASEIRKLAFFCRRLGCKLYVVHLTSRDGLEAVRQARGEGVHVIAETCPQYLVHTWEEDSSNLLLKHTPPLRSREDTEALWQALAVGEIQCMGTDHIPNYLEEKLGGGDLWQALSGSAEIETLLPLLLHHGVRRGQITLQRLAEVTSLNPARAFGVFPRKGQIAVGADADLTLVDLGLTRTVRLEEMESARETDYCTYEGQQLTGWPVLTLLRGRVIARNGAVVEAPPRGRYLHRSGAAA